MYTIGHLSETTSPANKGAYVYPTYADAVEKLTDLELIGYGVFELAGGAVVQADGLLQGDWPVVFNEPNLFQIRALTTMLVDLKQGVPYALFGLMDELGEFVLAGDTSNRLDELGDVHWYAAVASHFLGWPYAEVIGVTQAPSLNLPVPMLMELLREAMLPAFVTFGKAKQVYRRGLTFPQKAAIIREIGKLINLLDSFDDRTIVFVENNKKLAHRKQTQTLWVR